ncbi:hypothetical protein AVEN_202213-1 [Araneus ventricosus]|uniref:Uncharacterized protein n=1 Tax=Araneus ventricosus TaxID=182803 RepID=A0A4Y2PAF4_ARAVE|nr:hypothetical protein AVEN_192235-1 [Araneus ventricosus]GBN47217.1 hypothetical protein AVEN_202213-1 [Araneus ventricosus]
MEERSRQEEIEERKRQEEIVERRRREESERRNEEIQERRRREEYEERKRKDEVELPAVTSIGKMKGDIEVDNVKGEGTCIYIAPDDVQPVDLIIERTWLHLSHIAYAKIGKRFHIGQREDESFRNFRIDEKINRICLEDLDTTKLACVLEALPNK